MTVVEEIIGEFGGLTEMSRKLGHQHPTTVQGWKNSGRIPSWRAPEIRDAATRLGLERVLTLLDESKDAA